MTSKLTRERLQEIAEDGFLKHGESKELARTVLAAMDSEPVAYTDEQITQAMIEKLEVNKQRSWPEPKDGEPRLHIKERPRKKVDRCDVCTEGARGGCGTCIFNGKFE
ncbi:DUF550 domain-containing protein [Klebsiella pneumoniae]|nr:DUF550 domain-containing protein [Klebsiella pneumoniae]